MRGKKWWLAALALFLTAGLLQFLARQVPGFAQGYAVTVYRLLVEVPGRFLSLIPFSVAELGLYVLILSAAGGFFVLVWRIAVKRLRLLQAAACLLQAVFFAASLLLFTYTIGCGINYHRTPFSAESGFAVEGAAREELVSLCIALAEEINEAALQVPVDAQGCFVLEGDPAETARRAMAALGEEYPVLSGFYPQPKGLFFSRLLSIQKIEGIYSPFTLEANYNREMPDMDIPVTICHELSHLRGFMREDEANFVAYLACLASGDPQFIYSGSLLAFIHSSNALYRDGGREEYREIYQMLCEAARRDLARDHAFWKQFDGKVAEVSGQVNDVYLKVNKQEDGVKSYGRMVDLLLARFREERR